MLVIAGENIEHFSAINAVTAVYRIARALTSRAGRLRRKEASFITADPRFVKLVELVEASAAQLDKVGLENRKWAYHKLVLPGEYRAKSALSVRLLDRAKDLQVRLEARGSCRALFAISAFRFAHKHKHCWNGTYQTFQWFTKQK